MSRMIVAILFALSISQYANAAAVSDPLTDVRKLKSEVETVLKFLTFYTEHYIYELAEAQQTAENNFEENLNKNANAAFDEIKNAAQENGNSAKVNQCVEAAKAKLDSLEVNTPKAVEDCIENQEEEEINDFFDKLIDEISAGKKIQVSIESLEKDAEASSGRNSNVEKKLPAVKTSLDKLETTGNDLMEKGAKIMENVENQTKECSNKHLVNVQSSITEVKAHAFQCISQA